MRAAGKANELPKIKAKSKQMVAVAKEEVDIQEDGHTDVASAIRQCKTIVEDAMQITSKLQTMNPEDSLPSWWTNKLAVSSNSMNKLRDYFLVPTTEEVELEEKSEYGPDIRGEISQLQKMLKGLERGKKTPGKGFAKIKIKELIADLEKRQAQDDAVIKMRGEEVELDEVAGDLSDMKKLVGELQNASKMHLAQSKRVKAHVDMMKGSKDLEPIVGELEKASQAHQRQSKTIDAHIKGMKEYIEDELDEMKEPFVVVDTADGNKVVGTASDEKGARSIITTSQLPPMRIKDKKTLKIVKVKKKQMIGQPIKEEVELGEGYEKEVLLVLKDAGISGSFRSGRLYVDKQDVKDARSALKDSDKFRSLPRIVGEEVELDERDKKNRYVRPMDRKFSDTQKSNIQINQEVQGLYDRIMGKTGIKYKREYMRGVPGRKNKQTHAIVVNKKDKNAANKAVKNYNFSPIEKEVFVRKGHFVVVAVDNLDDRDSWYDKGMQSLKQEYIPEGLELDENASKAFDRIIKDGGIDKKDFQKAKQLYMKKDLTGLRKFIYNLDTAALEAIMDVISRNDSKAFMKMYPRSQGGDYMSSIAYAHRND
jgi:hypothetical protein